MIVVDTNIIAYLYIQSEFSELVESTIRKDSHWSAPLLWRSELRNVLTACMRKKMLLLSDASEIMGEAELLMRGNEYSVKSSTVLNLVCRSDCSAYDCEFVALAQDLQAPLVTMDKKILKNFPETALSLRDFVD
jgi:predicted nucleic acid-binding protein